MPWDYFIVVCCAFVVILFVVIMQWRTTKLLLDGEEAECERHRIRAKNCYEELTTVKQKLQEYENKAPNIRAIRLRP